MKKIISLLFVFLSCLNVNPSFAENKNGIDRVLLVIDTSGSMQGEKIDTAKKASLALIDQIPDGIDIGIISFENTVNVLLEPSSDKEAARAAVGKLKAFGYTSLYDGINKALMLTTPESGTKVLILSDGNDTKSTATLKNTLGLIDEKVTPLIIFSLSNDLQTNKILQEIADQSTGQMIVLKSINELPVLFADFGQIVKKVYPQDAFKIIPAQKYESRAILILIPVVLIFILGLILIRGAYTYYRDRIINKRRNDILDKYDLDSTALEEFKIKSIRRKILYSKLVSKYLRVQQEKLDLAGITNEVERWATLILLAVLLLLTITTNMFGNIFISAIISLVLIFALRNSVLNFLINKKLHSFEEALPDALIIMSSGLRSGLNLVQTLEAVANDADNEVARQLRRVMAELQIGTNLEIALGKVATRMKSNDLKLTVSALAIQREVGGNLSNILTTAATTIKGRGEIRREIRTLSAEGRTSAYVLVALPIGILIMTLFSQPGYIDLLLSNPIGIIFIFVVIFLMTLGWIWVKKVVDIKV